MANIAQGIDRLPDGLGHMVLNDDGAVMSSGGDLENDEPKAEIFISMMRRAAQIHKVVEKRETLKRISVIYDDFMYVLTAVGNKLYVSKRHYTPTDPVVA